MGILRPPGGESDRQAGERLYKKFIEEIVPATRGAEHIAIVSHGNVIRCMLQYVLGHPITYADAMQNTGMTSLAYDHENPGQFQVLAYNRIEHL